MVMTEIQRKVKRLKGEWRYVVGVPLMLAIPAYGVAGFTIFAAVAHLIAALLFLAGLWAFGRSYLLAETLPILLVVVVLAILGRALQKILNEQGQEYQQLSQQRL